jgi:hypothetical protein
LYFILHIYYLKTKRGEGNPTPWPPLLVKKPPVS